MDDGAAREGGVFLCGVDDPAIAADGGVQPRVQRLADQRVANRHFAHVRNRRQERAKVQRAGVAVERTVRLEAGEQKRVRVDLSR